MAYVKLPVRADLPAYEFEIELEGRVFFFSFNWNARIGKWFMTIKDQSQAVIVSGVKLLTGWPILERLKDTRLPLGTMFVIDSANEGKDPGVDELGSRHILMYRESTTVDE
jgi:hypothetical protein